ncbi:MAG: hypothetical protein AAF799_07705 [Myxococcota bacterium]
MDETESTPEPAPESEAEQQAGEQSGILKFGKIAFGSFLIGGATMGIVGMLDEPPLALRIPLGIVFVGSALTCMVAGGIGVLRYMMSFSSRKKTASEHLGFMLAATPLVIAYIAMRVMEVFF